MELEFAESEKNINRFNGSDFTEHDLFRFNSESFDKNPLNYWNGKEWVQYNG